MIQQVGVQVKFNTVVSVYGCGCMKKVVSIKFPWIWQNVPYLLFSTAVRLFYDLVVKCLNVVVSYCQVFDTGRHLEV